MTFLILVVATMIASTFIHLRHRQLFSHLLLNTVKNLYIMFRSGLWWCCCLILHINFVQAKLMKFLPFPSLFHLIKPIINFPVYSKFLELLHLASVLRVAHKTCRFVHSVKCMDCSYLAYLRLYSWLMDLTVVYTRPYNCASESCRPLLSRGCSTMGW